MRTLSIGTQILTRTLAVAAVAAVVACGGIGLLVTPILAGNAERDVLPKGEGVDEYLKQTKPANPAGAETRPPCAPPLVPWTVCKNHEIQQCRQTLSHFGTELCDYRDSCRNTGRYC